MKWKDIPIAPGYEASTAGDIRNKVTKRILKPYCDPAQEYDRVSIYAGGKRRKMLVHLLVASAYLGPKPDGMETDHLNTNIHDNRPKNLRYVPQGINHHNPITLFNREVARIKRAIASGKHSYEGILELIEQWKRK